MSVLFVECTLSGVVASWSECSISSVNFSQLAFLVLVGVLEGFIAGRKPEIAFGIDGNDDWYVIRGQRCFGFPGS